MWSLHLLRTERYHLLKPSLQRAARLGSLTLHCRTATYTALCWTHRCHDGDVRNEDWDIPQEPYERLRTQHGAIGADEPKRATGRCYGALALRVVWRFLCDIYSL